MDDDLLHAKKKNWIFTNSGGVSYHERYKHLGFSLTDLEIKI